MANTSTRTLQLLALLQTRRYWPGAELTGGRKAEMTTAEGVQRWLDGFGDAPFDYEVRDLEVVVGGDAAHAHGLARMGSANRLSGRRPHDLESVVLFLWLEGTCRRPGGLTRSSPR